MIGLETLAAIEARSRIPLTKFLPPQACVKWYSWGRRKFFKVILSSKPKAYVPPAKWSRTCWGLNFRSPLFNAAGMFKNGEGYEFSAAQGAGAYLAGTTTTNIRQGNSKLGVYLPFAPYPKSLAASNWLGLPNDGDVHVAERLQNFTRVPNCPVGASLMGSPDLQGQERLDGLIKGLFDYATRGIDFLELNESCPNTSEGRPQDGDLKKRLEYIAEKFLRRRAPKQKPPVIVKFSNDTDISQVYSLVELLISLGFDGVNFGNTSVAYAKYRQNIVTDEQKLFDYFTSNFGGGLSGALLRESSLELTQKASDAVRKINPAHEFHIIRTGGVSSLEDVEASVAAGASLVQWYTGYFEIFAQVGSRIYAEVFEG